MSANTVRDITPMLDLLVLWSTNGDRANWSVRGKNPRLTLFFKNKEQGFVTAPMDFGYAQAMVEAIKDVADSKEEVQYMVNHLNQAYDEATNEKIEGEKTIQATFYVGKDAKGVVYIALKSPKDEIPAIRFNFTTSQWFKAFKNKEDDTSKFSKFIAKSYAYMLRKNLNKIQDKLDDKGMFTFKPTISAAKDNKVPSSSSSTTDDDII